MKHSIRLIALSLMLVVALYSNNAGAQSYTNPIHVVDAAGTDHSYITPNNSFTSTVNLNWRWGYPKSNTWSVSTLKAGVAASPVTTGMANPQSEPLAVEFQAGTAAVVKMLYTYYCGVDASSPSVTFTAAASGAISAQLAPCPATGVAPAPTPIAAPATAVVTPPVTTPPPATSPTQVICQGSPSTTYAKDGTFTIVIPAYCMEIQQGGSWGTVQIGGYIVDIKGDPSLPLFAPANGTNMPLP